MKLNFQHEHDFIIISTVGITWKTTPHTAYYMLSGKREWAYTWRIWRVTYANQELHFMVSTWTIKSSRNHHCCNNKIAYFHPEDELIQCRQKLLQLVCLQHQKAERKLVQMFTKKLWNKKSSFLRLKCEKKHGQNMKIIVMEVVNLSS